MAGLFFVITQVNGTHAAFAQSSQNAELAQAPQFQPRPGRRNRSWARGLLLPGRDRPNGCTQSVLGSQRDCRGIDDLPQFLGLGLAEELLAHQGLEQIHGSSLGLSLQHEVSHFLDPLPIHAVPMYCQRGSAFFRLGKHARSPLANPPKHEHVALPESTISVQDNSPARNKPLADYEIPGLREGSGRGGTISSGTTDSAWPRRSM